MEEFSILNKINWLQVLAAATFGFVINILIQWMRLPALKIMSEPEFTDPPNYTDQPAKRVRFVRIRVKNNSPKWFLKYIIGGSLAPRCQGRITFFNEAGEKLFNSPMPARWAGSAEMIPFRGECSGVCPSMPQVPNVWKIVLHDFNLYKPTSWIDIFPGSTESLDVAAKFDDEDECYGWNNESYFSKTPWRNPERKLGPKQRFIFRVQVSCPGSRETSRLFRLDNRDSRNEFRIYKAPFADYLRVFWRKNNKAPDYYEPPTGAI